MSSVSPSPERTEIVGCVWFTREQRSYAIGEKKKKKRNKNKFVEMFTDL